MFNKKITIILIIAFFLIGGVVGFIIGSYVKGSDRQVSESNEKNSVVEEVKKDDGSEFIGEWFDKQSKIVKKRPDITITEPSKGTFIVNRGKERLIGKYKDGLLIGEVQGFRWTYTLKDGVLTETSDEGDIEEYIKENKSRN